MKTKFQSTPRPARHLPEMMKCLGLLLTAGTLASCGTGSAGKNASSLVIGRSPQWHGAQNDQSILLPKEMTASKSIRFENGNWLPDFPTVQAVNLNVDRESNTKPLTLDSIDSVQPGKFDELMHQNGQLDVKSAFDDGSTAMSDVPYEIVLGQYP